jgi:hypothetical protein
VTRCGIRGFVIGGHGGTSMDGFLDPLKMDDRLVVSKIFYIFPYEWISLSIIHYFSNEINRIFNIALEIVR